MMKTNQLEKAIELASKGYSFYEISKILKIDKNIVLGVLEMWREDRLKAEIICKLYDLELTSCQASKIIKFLKFKEIIE